MKRLGGVGLLGRVEIFGYKVLFDLRALGGVLCVLSDDR